MQCLILCGLCLVLASCGDAPKIELCQVDGDPKRLSLDCAKEDVGEYSRTAEAADGYICQSRRFAERFFQQCRDGQPIITEFCQVSASDHLLYCAAIREGEEVAYQLTWVQAAGHICTGPGDLEKYLDWCYR